MDTSVFPASLLSLSDEILLIIFSFLGTKEKVVLSKVCCRLDRILLDEKLCRNFEISPNQNGFCLKSLGSYLRNRRQLISKLNINSCHWIPMQQIKFITKRLINLHSLHVMNISMPVPILSEILKQCKQMRELSWSWRGDAKINNVTWSNVDPECRLALSNLVRLYLCIPDPLSDAVQEFLLVHCCGLTHLTLQIDAALGKIRTDEEFNEENSFVPLKLKSLIVYHVSYGKCSDQLSMMMSEIKLGALVTKLWNNSGGWKNKWECFWTSSSCRLNWLHELPSSSDFALFLSNLKSVTLSSIQFPHVHNELPVTDLIIVVKESTVPFLHAVAPKVEKLTFDVTIFEVSSEIITSIHGLDYLVELNLFGVHFCVSTECIKNLWHCIKKLVSLRKLAVAPCAMPRNLISTSNLWDEDNFTISCASSTTDVNKDLYERMKLDHLEVFEIGAKDLRGHPCQTASWIPYISVISIWKSLTCLTFDTITYLRTMAEFKLVAKTCVNLSHLRFREIGPEGHCGYVKDIANALPYCYNLKHFGIEQCHIADFLKDLLMGLSNCILLESIYISNSNGMEHSSLKGKQSLDLQKVILDVINSCTLLHFIRVPLPNVTKNSCKKMRSWISSKLTSSNRVNIIMEFCEKLEVFEEQYHAFPPDAPRLEYVRWISKVAMTPSVS